MRSCAMRSPARYCRGPPGWHHILASFRSQKVNLTWWDFYATIYTPGGRGCGSFSSFPIYETHLHPYRGYAGLRNGTKPTRSENCEGNYCDIALCKQALQGSVSQFTAGWLIKSGGLNPIYVTIEAHLGETRMSQIRFLLLGPNGGCFLGPLCVNCLTLALYRYIVLAKGSGR